MHGAGQLRLRRVPRLCGLEGDVRRRVVHHLCEGSFRRGSGLGPTPFSEPQAHRRPCGGFPLSPAGLVWSGQERRSGQRWRGGERALHEQKQADRNAEQTALRPDEAQAPDARWCRGNQLQRDRDIDRECEGGSPTVKVDIQKW